MKTLFDILYTSEHCMKAVVISDGISILLQLFKNKFI